MPVTSYSRTPASNNSAAPNGAPEGWAPSAVNDWARQHMADVVNEAGKGSARVLASVSGTNTITASMTPDLDAYAAGMIVVLTPANSITGAATLNIDSLGALDIQKQDGDALVSGDMVAGIPYVLVLDSGADDWILLNPMSLASLSVGGNEVGYRNLIQNDQGAGYTLTDADRGKAIVPTSGTVTLASAFTAGGICTVIAGTAALTLSASTGSLFWFNGSGSIPSGSLTLAIGGVASVYRLASGNWAVWGVGLS